MRIWIDLANTPHVLFFEPVIRELRTRGHSVTLTARRFANTLPLAEARGLQPQAIGDGHDASRSEAHKRERHQRRTAELVAFARGRFDLAVSHASYTQMSAALELGLPAFATVDYEHKGLAALRDARCLMVPAVIPLEALEACGLPAHIIRSYDGLKEHVYLADFRPDPTVRARLGVAPVDRLVVFRPIADHAVYTDHSGDGVQHRLVERLAAQPGVHLLVVPRTADQGRAYAELGGRLPAVRVLGEMIHGPSLIAAADLVVCGGGTMLREAAVLGVPAVSIFPGKHGAVDRWLASENRIALVRGDADVHGIHLARRAVEGRRPVNGVALAQIVEGICATGQRG
jgi:predicted glycosyltransferase